MIVSRLSIPGNLCVHCGTKITEQLQCSGCEWVDPLTTSKEDYESKRRLMDNATKSIKQRTQEEKKREEQARKGVQMVLLIISPALIWLLIQIYNLMLS